MARQRKTGSQLAEQLKCSQQTASRRMNGHTDIDLDSLEIIAAWLDVPIHRLITPRPSTSNPAA